ncbi:hypothetical protein BD413DRAFT_200331 [Trametes elegans]|nr:hypothetical protein BD413DRAFT_200331 [Trametes elegans]
MHAMIYATTASFTTISARETPSSGSTPTYGRRPSERMTVGTRSIPGVISTRLRVLDEFRDRRTPILPRFVFKVVVICNNETTSFANGHR